MAWWHSASPKVEEWMCVSRLTDGSWRRSYSRTITEFQTSVNAQIKEHETQRKTPSGTKSGGRIRHFEAALRKESKRWDCKISARGEKSGEKHMLHPEKPGAGPINGRRLSSFKLPTFFFCQVFFFFWEGCVHAPQLPFLLLSSAQGEDGDKWGDKWEEIFENDSSGAKMGKLRLS